jgi:glycosyltransferase involved in cell wall biosynthesis
MPTPPPSDDALRIAFLIYRGNRHCGGQGIYTRHLTRELANLGHHVEVFSGPPYPEVDEPVVLHELGGIDFYGGRKPLRKTAFLDIRSDIDFLEYLMICTAAFPEPFAFSLRALRKLRKRVDDFDIVHDNQSLAWGLLGMERAGLPVVATLHHPVTVDRELDLAHAETIRRKISLRRFYGFLRMQKKVAPQLRRIVTVSESSKRDISTQMGVPFDNMSVVPVGVDHEVFKPLPHVAKVPGRLMTTASADVPMKGLRYLLEAVAKLRTERDVELTVIGKPRDESGAPRLIRELGIDDAVTFVSGVEQERIVELYAEAEVAVVPSLYEGFSLPAIEAMACGVPVVGTTGGAVPEVVGRDNETALIVPTSDAGALATAIARLLDDSALRDRIGHAGRQRVMDRFTWKACAVGTAEQYRVLLESRKATAAARADG